MAYRRSGFAALWAVSVVVLTALTPIPVSAGQRGSTTGISEAQDAAEPAEPTEDGRVHRSQPTTLDASALRNEGTAPADSEALAPGGRRVVPGRAVTVELLDGISLQLDPIEVTERLPYDAVGTSPVLEWNGVTRDEAGMVVAGASLTVVPTEAGDVMSGSVEDYRTNATYVLRHVEGDDYIIDEETGGSTLPVDVASGPQPRTGSRLLQAAPAQPCGSDLEPGWDSVVVDVVIGYGNSIGSGIVADIANRVTELNRAFFCSGMNQRVNLVATPHVDYDQSASIAATDLDNLELGVDDLAQLHVQRDQYAADLVMLVVPNATDACGVARVPGTTGSVASSFSVAARSCFTGDRYVIAHELGHSLGGSHNPEQDGFGNHPYPFSHGRVVDGVARTILAYEQQVDANGNITGDFCPSVAGAAGCPMRLQFSNPGVAFSGTTVASGEATWRNNAQSLSNLAPWVAGYRTNPAHDAAHNGVGAIAYSLGGLTVEEVFYVGPNHDVRRRRLTTSWSGETSVGGLAISDPAAVSWGAGRVDIFVLSNDRRIWHQGFQNGTPTGWDVLAAGQFNSAPTAISRASGSIDIFARGLDGQLYQSSWNGTWTSWTPRGGSFLSGPAAASWSSSRVDLVARGLDNALWHSHWAGAGWSGWVSLGGTITQDPGATSYTQNRVDIVVRGAGTDAYHQRWNGGTWVGYSSMGGLFASALDVTYRGASQLSAYGRGVDGHVYRNTGNGTTWSGWVQI